MAARDDFLNSLGHYELAIGDPVLVSKAPREVGHNGKARLLRNGLAVACFAALEDFLKSRFRETLSRIDGNSARFDDLPAALRSAALDGVAQGVAAQLRIRSIDEPERSRMIVEAARAMASSQTAAYEISPLVFGSHQSNLNLETIKEALRNLQVEGGWQALGDVATAARAGHPSLASSFRSFAQARHSAAHDARAEVALPDLETYGQVALSTALAFDALVSRACARLSRGDPDLLEGGTGSVTSAEIEVVFVEKTTSGARELNRPSARALKVHPSTEAAMASASRRPANSGRVVVLLDQRGLPAAWKTTDIP